MVIWSWHTILVKLATAEIVYRIIFYFEVFFEICYFACDITLSVLRELLAREIFHSVRCGDPSWWAFLFSPPVISICQIFLFSSDQFSVPHLMLLPPAFFTVLLFHLTFVIPLFPIIAYWQLSIFCGLVLFPNITFLLKTQFYMLFFSNSVFDIICKPTDPKDIAPIKTVLLSFGS